MRGNIDALMEAFGHYFLSPFPEINDDTLAGNRSNTIAGRICNYFDLGGGGFATDGACSPSLLAIAHACNALMNRDLDYAFAGGVDVSLDPFEVVGFAKTKALAVDDIRPYDQQAAGMLPGEGCGLRSSSAWPSVFPCPSAWGGVGIPGPAGGRETLAPHRATAVLSNGINSFPLMAVPFFILAADLMSASGITISLLRFTSNMVGHIRGGLGHVNVLTLMQFAGISGSALADAAGPGALIMRMMKKAGYDEYYSAALTASTAIMGPIIPPSIILVIYAITKSKVTVAGLFLAGVLPGILMALALIATEPHHGHPPQLPLPVAAGHLERAAEERLEGDPGLAHAGDHHRRHLAASSPRPKPRRWPSSTLSSSASSSPRS